MSDVTRILNAIEQGDARAADQLLPLVYEELRRLAAQKMAREKPGQTIQATALVHEAYIRLVGSQDQNWNSRTNFFVAAAEAMRRILIENARRKQRLKRGGDHEKVNLDDIDLAIEEPAEDIVALDEALEKLSLEDPAKANLVKLRYFAGFTTKEAANMLGISQATAERYWSYARVWLFYELKKGS
ncbi:MAG: sigma-70 family RNA polymerase sigma factor [Phycisphaerales bacterium]|nr:MAG: sigma-70 family RNA polymerase sigma factor [Phycisphaerales bacterium]UCF16342.1 MAG: sigma-70 family RNA polymerase sigma factor [Phycisphaerales bacterium]